MGMTRQERNALHKKQERTSVGTGLPSVSNMTEGVPQLRNVHGKGLTEYTKYNGVLHEKVLEESGRKKISKPNTWYNFTFENSWANYGATWQTAQYSIDSNGFVHLRGLIKDGSTSADITSLPTGFQPVMDELFVVRTSAGTSRVDIKTDGDVYANPGHASWTSLSGITFEAEKDKV